MLEETADGLRLALRWSSGDRWARMELASPQFAYRDPSNPYLADDDMVVFTIRLSGPGLMAEVEVDAARARRFLVAILHKDLAYKREAMTEHRAKWLAGEFFRSFGKCPTRGSQPTAQTCRTLDLDRLEGVLAELGQPGRDEIVRTGRRRLARGHALGATNLVDSHLVERPVGPPQEQPDIARSEVEQFLAEEELAAVLGGAGVGHVIVVRNDRENAQVPGSWQPLLRDLRTLMHTRPGR